MPLFDSTTHEEAHWDTMGLPIPPDVPTERAVWMHDIPTLGSLESDHRLEADVEFVIAVYNRKRNRSAGGKETRFFRQRTALTRAKRTRRGTSRSMDT
jgi:hypothetical protein